MGTILNPWHARALAKEAQFCNFLIPPFSPRIADATRYDFNVINARTHRHPPSQPSVLRLPHCDRASRLSDPGPPLSTFYFDLSTLRAKPRAFTLIELLVVMGIISLLMVLVVPAFTNLKGSGDITNAAETIAGVLAQARTYSIANNTYTWVGFYEEAGGSLATTNATPPYPGKGRLIVATVASKDGTNGCEDSASTTGTRILLTATKILQVGKLVKLEGVHMTDVGAPAPGTTPIANPNALDARPDSPYTDNAPSADYQNRINSDDTHAPENQTLYPFVAQGYTFYKTIRFTPRGEAQINGTYNMRRVVEIGLRPTHGSTVDSANPNVVALQFSAIGGNFKIYRR